MLDIRKMQVSFGERIYDVNFECSLFTSLSSEFDIIPLTLYEDVFLDLNMHTDIISEYKSKYRLDYLLQGLKYFGAEKELEKLCYHIQSQKIIKFIEDVYLNDLLKVQDTIMHKFIDHRGKIWHTLALNETVPMEFWKKYPVWETNEEYRIWVYNREETCELSVLARVLIRAPTKFVEKYFDILDHPDKREVIKQNINLSESFILKHKDFIESYNLDIFGNVNLSMDTISMFFRTIDLSQSIGSGTYKNLINNTNVPIPFLEDNVSVISQRIGDLYHIRRPLPFSFWLKYEPYVARGIYYIKVPLDGDPEGIAFYKRNLRYINPIHVPEKFFNIIYEKHDFKEFEYKNLINCESFSSEFREAILKEAIATYPYLWLSLSKKVCETIPFSVIVQNDNFDFWGYPCIPIEYLRKNKSVIIWRRFCERNDFSRQGLIEFLEENLVEVNSRKEITEKLSCNETVPLSFWEKNISRLRGSIHTKYFPLDFISKYRNRFISIPDHKFTITPWKQFLQENPHLSDE